MATFLFFLLKHCATPHITNLFYLFFPNKSIRISFSSKQNYSFTEESSSLPDIQTAYHQGEHGDIQQRCPARLELGMLGGWGQHQYQPINSKSRSFLKRVQTGALSPFLFSALLPVWELIPQKALKTERVKKVFISVNEEYCVKNIKSNLFLFKMTLLYLFNINNI